MKRAQKSPQAASAPSTKPVTSPRRSENSEKSQSKRVAKPKSPPQSSPEHKAPTNAQKKRNIKIEETKKEATSSPPTRPSQARSAKSQPANKRNVKIEETKQSPAKTRTPRNSTEAKSPEKQPPAAKAKRAASASKNTKRLSLQDAGASPQTKNAKPINGAKRAQTPKAAPTDTKRQFASPKPAQAPKRTDPKVKPEDEPLYNLRTAAKEITDGVLIALSGSKGKEAVSLLQLFATLFTPGATELVSVEQAQMFCSQHKEVKTLLDTTHWLLRTGTISAGTIRWIEVALADTSKSSQASNKATSKIAKFLEQVISYYHKRVVGIPRQKSWDVADSPRRFTHLKQFSNVTSPVRGYINDRSPRFDADFVPIGIDELLQQDNPDMMQIHFAQVQQRYELKRMRSLERLDKWNDERMLKRCRSDEQLRREVFEINFANKQRKSQAILESDELSRRKTATKEHIEDKKVTFQFVREAKRKQTVKDNEIDVERGKERSKIAQKTKEKRMKTTIIKEICLSEFLRKMHLDPSDRERESEMNAIKSELKSMKQEQQRISARTGISQV